MKNIQLNENDLILYNGACYQIVTKSVREGWYSYPAIINKLLFEKLKELDIVYTNEELDKLAKNQYIIDCTLYKVDIKKLSEHGTITINKMSISCE